MSIIRNIEANYLLIVAAIALVAFQYFLRRRRGPGESQQQTVQGLLIETKLNLRIAEVYTFDYRTRRLVTTTWRLHKNKLDFLGDPLRDSVDHAFMMAEDFNKQLAAAKKNKSTVYMAGINIDKVKVLLSACQDGLEQWNLKKVGSKNPPIKVPGMFDDLLGRH